MKRNYLNSAVSTFGLALFGLWFNQPAYAAEVSFMPDEPGRAARPMQIMPGSVAGVFPIEKLGTIPLPRGRLQLEGASANVTVVPEWRFERLSVLAGQVLDSHATVLNGGSLIQGVILFDRGDWINYFDDRSSPEEIETTKVRIIGHIQEIAASSLKVVGADGKTTSVPISDITRLKSSRAFQFTLRASTLQALPSNGLTYSAPVLTVALQPESGMPPSARALRALMRKLMDDGDLSTARLVAIGAAFDLAQLGQVAPAMIVPISSGRLASKMLQRQMQSLEEVPTP